MIFLDFEIALKVNNHKFTNRLLTDDLQRSLL